MLNGVFRNILGSISYLGFYSLLSNDVWNEKVPNRIAFIMNFSNGKLNEFARWSLKEV